VVAIFCLFLRMLPTATLLTILCFDLVKIIL